MHPEPATTRLKERRMDRRDFYSHSMVNEKEITWWWRILPFVVTLAVLLGLAVLGVTVGEPKGKTPTGPERLHVGS
jgi:hypothetical protein